MADNSRATPGAVALVPAKKGQKRRRTRSHNSSSPSPGRGFFVPGFDNAATTTGGFKMMSLNELVNCFFHRDICHISRYVYIQFELFKIVYFVKTLMKTTENAK